LLHLPELEPEQVQAELVLVKLGLAEPELGQPRLVDRQQLLADYSESILLALAPTLFLLSSLV